MVVEIIRNGEKFYLHTAWADDISGNGFSLTEYEDALYIGNYFDRSSSESNFFQKYDWKENRQYEEEYASDDYNKRITDLEAMTAINADDLSSAQMATDISIGNPNLLIDTNNGTTNYSVSSGYTIEEVIDSVGENSESIKCVKVTCNTFSDSGKLYFNTEYLRNLLQNSVDENTYTISMYTKMSELFDIGEIAVQNIDSSKQQLVFEGISNNISDDDITMTDEWSYYESTAQYTGIESDEQSLCLSLSNMPQGTSLVIANLKIEEGATATPWRETVPELSRKLVFINGKIIAAEAEIQKLKATAITAAEADIKYAAIATLEATDAKITSLSGELASFRSGEFETLKAKVTTISEAYIDEATVDTLIASKGFVTEAEVGIIIADKGYFTEQQAETLIASKGYITAAQADTLVVSKGYLTEADVRVLVAGEVLADYAKVTELEAAAGRITDLTAKAITTDNLEANIADFGFITTKDLSANFATIDLANVAAGSITQAMIGEGVVGTMQIADGSITDAKIVELTANKITAGTLSVERLEIRGSINSLVYALNDITGALQAQSVDTLNGEILTPRTITADRIVAGSITAEEIAVNAITANKILAGAITTEKIDAYAVTAGKIAAGAVTAETIYAGSVTAEKIDVDTLSAISANLGTITAGVLQSENYQESNYSVDDEGNATSPVLSGLKIDLNNTAYYTPQITIKDNYINLNGYMTIGQRVLDKNIYPGVYSFVQGKGCEAAGYCSHAEGGHTQAIGPASHAEGYNTIAGTKAPGFEGYLGAHAQGINTQALYSGSHSEGYNTMALAEYAHVEGNGCTASGSASHAEGYNCITRGYYSHVEGKNCTAYNEASHVEGIDNEEKESFGANHIEGEKNVVRMSADSYAKATHVGGIGNIGYGGWAQRIIGRYNIIDYTPHSGNPYGDYVLIVGNGTSDTSRSNAHMLDWNGNAWFAGNVTVGASKKQLATTDHTHSNYVDLTSAQTITGAKTFNSSNVFNGEQKFSNASYCPTITDSASGVGCAFKASRGLFNEALIDKLIMTSSTAKIPFYKYTGTSGGSMTGLTEVASISNGGALSCIGEISTTSANAFRSKQGNYGFFIRNDGANVYFMLTDSGNSGGNWNSLRPFTVNCSTGNTSVGHAFDVGGITTVAARIQPKSTVTTVNLGYNDVANHRWANIYSKTSVNVSSDIRVKTDINEIDERYIQLFDLIQPYSYKFIDGTSGRTHTGFISQYVEEALYQVGLESTDLAFFCKDPMFEEIFDNSGNVVGTKPVLDENGDQVYFYSLRYEEYIAIMTAKIKKLEKSIQRQAGELEIVKSKQESTEMKFIAAMMKVAELEKNIERLKLAS